MNPLDSVTIVENGTISISGNWERPQIINIREAKTDPRIYKSFISENESLEVNIEIPGSQKLALDNFTFHYVETPLSKEFLAYEKPLLEITKEADSLDVEWQKLRAKYDRIPKDVRAPIDMAYEKNYAKKDTFLRDYIATHNSIITQYLYLTDLRFTYGFEGLKKIVTETPEGHKNSVYGKILTGKLNILEHIQIGAVAPDIVKPDTKGNMLALSSLRGKYVLLDFWASWCGPCRKENPWVKKAYERYKDKGFDVYAVSFDYPKDKEKWLKAIAEDQLPWNHVSSLQGWNDSVAKIYNISGIPAPFLLSPEGKILAKGNELREEALLNELEKYLNK